MISENDLLYALLPCIARDCFRNSNLWYPSHMTIILLLRQGSPSELRDNDIKLLLVYDRNVLNVIVSDKQSSWLPSDNPMPKVGLHCCESLCSFCEIKSHLPFCGYGFFYYYTGCCKAFLLDRKAIMLAMPTAILYVRAKFLDKTLS